MSGLWDTVFWPQRAVERAASDAAELVAAAARIARSADQVSRSLSRIERHAASIDSSFARHHDLPGQVAELQRAFDRSNDEIQALRDEMRPLVEEMRLIRKAVEHADEEVRGLQDTLEPAVEDLDRVSDAVEPLQSATERVGRLAERLPGGRRRE